MFLLVPGLCWSLLIPCFCPFVVSYGMVNPPSYPKCCDRFDSLFITLMLKSSGLV